jgi:hypothetical protein
MKYYQNSMLIQLIRLFVALHTKIVNVLILQYLNQNLLLTLRMIYKYAMPKFLSLSSHYIFLFI